jgi:hypothetical protein
MVLDRVSDDEAEQILALQAALMSDPDDIPWTDSMVEVAP